MINKYKQLITSSHKQHVIVADEDNLFEYREIQQAIEDDGYRLLFANTDLDVRILFELEVRESNQRCFIVANGSYKPLPDILQEVHFQRIGLKDLFANLDAKAIKGLSFSSLCLISNIKLYEELGREKTIKFLLENLYNVDFDTLTSSRQKERILNALIVVLLEKNTVNPPITTFLTNLARSYFPELVANGLNKENLIHYLHQKWTAYLQGLECDIDFEEAILNKSFGHLFVFGHMSAVKVSFERFKEIPKALTIGAFFDEKESNDAELEALIEYLNEQCSRIEDLYDQWFSLIQILARAKLKDMNSSNEQLRQHFKQVEMALNNRFQRFIDNTYGSLFSLSGVRKPVVISRVLDYIMALPEEKKALIVIDGMNYWQWLLLSEELKKSGLEVQSKATLAYIPTITAWSRQALFKGTKPDLSEGNERESKLFSEYLKDKVRVADTQIGFFYFSINKPIEAISEDIRLFTLVTNDLDDIMHGSVLGNQQLMQSTLKWIEQAGIVQNVKVLMDRGFKVFITTDHGNVDATGIKNLKISEKVGTLTRGKRHIYFSNETMLQNFIDKNPNLTFGIRNNSIYLRLEDAFTEQDVKVVTHGGSHLWEVLIPFGEVY